MSSYTEKAKTPCQLKCNISKLQDLPFFAKLPEKVVKLIAFLCRNNTLEKDEILFNEGDESSQCVIVISGSFALTSKLDAKEITRTASSGDVIGCLSLLGSFASIFTMKATEPSDVIIIDQKIFNKIVSEFPEIYPLAIKQIVKNIAEWDRRQCSSLDKPRGGISLL